MRAVYDAFFEGVPDVLAFEQEDDPLAFRANGMRVYAVFLTERARQFLAEAMDWPESKAALEEDRP